MSKVRDQAWEIAMLTAERDALRIRIDELGTLLAAAQVKHDILRGRFDLLLLDQRDRILPALIASSKALGEHNGR